MQDLFGSSSEGSEDDDDDAQPVLSDEAQPVDDGIDETQTASPTDEALPSTQAHMDELFGDDDSDEQEEVEEEHTRNMKGLLVFCGYKKAYSKLSANNTQYPSQYYFHYHYYIKFTQSLCHKWSEKNLTLYHGNRFSDIRFFLTPLCFKLLQMLHKFNW